MSEAHDPVHGPGSVRRRPKATKEALLVKCSAPFDVLPILPTMIVGTTINYNILVVIADVTQRRYGVYPRI